MSALLAAGAVAATAAVLVHGVVGHRWMREQLAVDLPSSALFGDADVTRRIFAVTWHAVTALFAVTAAALGLMALDVVTTSPTLLRFLSALYVAVLLVGVLFFVRRLDAWRRPVPPVFALSMTTVAVTSWLAGR